MDHRRDCGHRTQGRGLERGAKRTVGGIGVGLNHKGELGPGCTLVKRTGKGGGSGESGKAESQQERGDVKAR